MPIQKKSEPEKVRIQYRVHVVGPKEPRMRVRRSDWAGDTFEVMEHPQFLEAIALFSKFGFPIEDLDCTDP